MRAQLLEYLRTQPSKQYCAVLQELKVLYSLNVGVYGFEPDGGPLANATEE